MNKPFTTLLLALCFAATFAAGVAGGYYWGKATVLERFVLVTEQAMAGVK